jgi:hypothetical protein
MYEREFGDEEFDEELVTEEEKFDEEVLRPLLEFEELEKDTKRLVLEKKKLHEKNLKITEAWNKAFQKSMETNAEIFMDLKQELNKILEVEDKKIINREISDREDREFKRIEKAIKQIENLELEKDKESEEADNERYIYRKK